MVQGFETSLFKEQFHDWIEAIPLPVDQRAAITKRSTSIARKERSDSI